MSSSSIRTARPARATRPTLAALGIVGVLALAAWPGSAGAAFKRQGDAKAFFFANGTPAMKFTGKGTDVTVADDGKVVTITVGLASMETGIELRDKHMREKYLETGKWPTARLEIDKAKLELPAEGASVKSKVTGTLDLHGTKKKVKVGYQIEKREGAYVVRGALNLNMNDYGITVPNYVGVTVEPDVAVAVSFVAKDL